MVGRTLKHYRVQALLGKGGMGTVYRAVDPRLNRAVALKVLSEKLTADPDRRRRFIQEAQAACAINHPAIAQIYDVDEDDGVTFIAMELVDGKTVRQLIRDRELDVLGAVEIAVQVGEGMAKAHAAGIVHRDIKAENVMVTRDGHAKILDFGLAKLLVPAAEASGDGDAGLSAMETVAETQAGLVLGTVGYMSPEQARARTVDHRSDIFSIGVVLYEMVTGQRPFSGNTPLDTLYAIAFEETRPVTAIRSDLPPSLQRVVSRCLRKRPEDRYATTEEVVRDLEAVRREIETGISQPVPLLERLREEWSSFRERTPAEMAWPAAIGLAAVVLVIYLLVSGNVPWGTLLVVAAIGAVVYRRFRNRNRRLLNRFASRVAKMPEVRLITFDGSEATVVVDRAVARTYVRVNALMDKVNSSMFHGEPYRVTVRDDVSDSDVQTALRGSGVLYVRDDVAP